MDKDPSNEVFVLSLLKGYGIDEAEAMETEPAPLRRIVLTVKIRQPSHDFTFGVGISFIPYPLVLTPVV
jgi:hypothetical protein